MSVLIPVGEAFFDRKHYGTYPLSRLLSMKRKTVINKQNWRICTDRERQVRSISSRTGTSSSPKWQKPGSRLLKWVGWLSLRQQPLPLCHPQHPRSDLHPHDPPQSGYSSIHSEFNKIVSIELISAIHMP